VVRATSLVALAALLLVAGGCGRAKKSEPKTAEKYNQTCITLHAGQGPEGSQLCGDEAKAFCEGRAGRMRAEQVAECKKVIEADPNPIPGQSSAVSCPKGKYAKYEGKNLVGCTSQPPVDQSESSQQGGSSGGNGSSQGSGGGSSGTSGQQYCYEQNAPNRFEPGCQGTYGPPPQNGGSPQGGSGSDGSGQSGSDGSGQSGSDGSGQSGSGQGGGGTGHGTPAG
jgi:hypothetical protein